MSKSSPDYSLHTGASGGGKLGRTRDFLKDSDGADANIVKRHGSAAYKNPTDKTQDYGVKSADTVNKGSGLVPVPPKRTGNKSLSPIKPRS